MTDSPGAEEQNGRLVIRRIHHYRDTIRSYQVWIDRQRAGVIRDRMTQEIMLRPGSHTVRLQLLWLFSPTVTVEVTPCGETTLICGPNGGILSAWRLFLAPATAIFLRPAPADSSDD